MIDEYDLNFAEAMSKASELILYNKPSVRNNGQASLYTALVSCEISLKHLIAKAGQKVPRTHKLEKLMDLVSKCTVKNDGTYRSERERMSANGFLAITVDSRYPYGTVGKLLTGEKQGASKYPNGIRYGGVIYHYPPDMIQKASVELIEWVRKNAPSIQGPENQDKI